MSIKEKIDEAYLKWVEANYAYALFEVNLQLKWERVCLEQQGFIPEVGLQIPNAWRARRRLNDSRILEFLDCSRELVS